jgi:pimeloyl-ACP methyl ester carboxylesterase
MSKMRRAPARLDDALAQFDRAAASRAGQAATAELASVRLSDSAAFCEHGRMHLVFLHGGLANRTVWREQLRLFAGESPCLAPDLPGHGSREHETPGTAAHLVDEVAASFDGLCVVVGHSVGGLLALEMARRHGDRVRGVVTLESPVTPPAEHAVRSRATLAALRAPGAIDAWAMRMVPRDSPHHGDIVAMMRATRLEVAEWAIALALDYDTLAAVRELSAPLLIVDGAVDDKRLLEANPRARRARTSGGSHYVQLDCAEEVHRLIAAFVAELA